MLTSLIYIEFLGFDYFCPEEYTPLAIEALSTIYVRY